MQKVFQSCYVLDQRCYEHFGLTEDILMEHAAMGMAQYIRTHFTPGRSVLIAAGSGNNGADGIVLARLLYVDYDVRLFLPFGVKSPMCALQLERTKLLGITLSPEITDADVVVDALFGAGLTRVLDGKTQGIIHKLNSLPGYKIACDLPTGIGEDGQRMPLAFEADVTLTMGAFKEALYLDESKDSVGKVERIDLGISSTLYETESHCCLLEAGDIRLPSRCSGTTHKGDFGHVAIFTGEKEGAGIIAGSAAIRFGAGLTTLVVHERVTVPPYLMHSTNVPENATALAVGMGLGNHFDADFLKKCVIKSHLPIVLDADALSNKKLLSVVEQRDRDIVLTPHPKEFTVLWEILTGELLTVAEVQAKRFEVVRRFNARYPHVTLLLKGANMLMMQEEKLYINPLGSARLSKGGSGDVLSGLIVALLAQGYTGIDAAIQASLALTLSASAYEGASYAMVPTDLIDGLVDLESLR